MLNLKMYYNILFVCHFATTMVDQDHSKGNLGYFNLLQINIVFNYFLIDYLLDLTYSIFNCFKFCQSNFIFFLPMHHIHQGGLTCKQLYYFMKHSLLSIPNLTCWLVCGARQFTNFVLEGCLLILLKGDFLFKYLKSLDGLAYLLVPPTRNQ